VHAESYLLELERNSGLTKTQYADDRGITTERLRNALFFTDVPKEIRDFVTAGELPFTVAVELGRALPVIREDVVSKYVDEYGVGTEWDTVTYELCLRTVTEELIRYASVFNTNRSVKGVIALIRLETKHKMDTLHPSGEPNFGGIDDDFFRNPTAGKTRRAQLIAAITSNLQSVVSSRGLQQRALHRDIRKLAEIEDEGTDLDTEAEDATAQLGQSVLLATKAS
jgi:hypothetical protein